jgi:hypothetical protein
MKKGRAPGKILAIPPADQVFPGGRLHYDGRYANCNEKVPDSAILLIKRHGWE